MLYAMLNIVALALVFLFVPETRLKTLKELDQLLMILTRLFVVYQTTEHLPWWVRRYVLQREKTEMRPIDEHTEYQELEQDYE